MTDVFCLTIELVGNENCTSPVWIVLCWLPLCVLFPEKMTVSCKPQPHPICTTNYTPCLPKRSTSIWFSVWWSDRASGDCYLPGPLLNGRTSWSLNPGQPALVRYRCNSGYSLVGPGSQTCSPSGEWLPRADRIACIRKWMASTFLLYTVCLTFICTNPEWFAHHILSNNMVYVFHKV